MKRYDHLRVKARLWRTEGLSIDDICARLSLSKGTVYHWIKDMPLARPAKVNWSAAVKAASCAAKRPRDDAYALGLNNFDALSADHTFRDFVVLFMTEGSRRERHSVAIANSNPALVGLAANWLRRLSPKPIMVVVQHHIDQDSGALVRYWAELLSVDVARVSVGKKSNSGQLHGRKWRSVHGVATVRVFDTYLREKMRAWSDQLEKEWKLNSGTRAQGGPPDLGSGHRVSSILTVPTVTIV